VLCEFGHFFTNYKGREPQAEVFSFSGSRGGQLRPWGAKTFCHSGLGNPINLPPLSFARPASRLARGRDLLLGESGPAVPASSHLHLSDRSSRACAISTDRIAVTASGNSALMVASQLLLEPGDRVVTVTPLWPNAVEIPKVVGGQVTCVSLEVRDGQWALPLEKLLKALTPGTRMLVLNSPNNPTGWTIQRSEQQRHPRTLPSSRDMDSRGRCLRAPDIRGRIAVGSIVSHAHRRSGSLDRGQQLLQSLDDDRLACGLDGRATRNLA
jgi:hypothetical protein